MITVNSLTQKYIFMVTGNIRDLDPDVMDSLSRRREMGLATSGGGRLNLWAL